MTTEQDQYTAEQLDSTKTDVESQTKNPEKKDNNSFVNRDIEENVVLESIVPNPYDLAYACLMIPRFASHQMVGDLVPRIYEWLQQICISYGWRLDLENVQADYLQWILYVPPSTPPAHFMRIIRRQTSAQIFEEFPRFKRENLSDDFWAPGYLTLPGNRLHSPQMIIEYTKMTRRQQGLLEF